MVSGIEQRAVVEILGFNPPGNRPWLTVCAKRSALRAARQQDNPHDADGC